MSLWNDIRLLASPWDWFSGEGKERILSSQLGSPLHGLRAQLQMQKIINPAYQTVKVARNTRDLIRGDMSFKHFLKSGKDDYQEAFKHNWPVAAVALGGAALGGGGGGAGGGAAAGASEAPFGFGPGMSLETAAPEAFGATPGINPMAGGGAAAAGGGSNMFNLPSFLGGTAGYNPQAGGPFAEPPVTGGLFGDAPMGPGGDARMAAAANLLMSSGYSPTPTTNAEVIGRALLGAQQAKALALKAAQERKEAEQVGRLREAQIGEIERGKTPQSVREYEYARANGFEGSYEEWQTLKSRAAGGAEAPASIQEYQLYVSQAMQAGQTPMPFEQWLRTKAQMTPINPSVQVVAGAPSVVQPQRSGAPIVTPISTPQAERDAAAAAAAATATGKTEAERRATQIDVGMDAADALSTVKRGLELLGEVETGGIDAAKLKATNLFGVTGADEAELSANLGKAVLSQLRATFGAQFTEKEGQRLAEIEAGFGKSTEGNKRLLEQAQKILERAARRGIRAAEAAGDEESAREIREAMEFSLSPVTGGPKVGTVEDGYRFKGGNPANKANWELAR